MIILKEVTRWLIQLTIHASTVELVSKNARHKLSQLEMTSTLSTLKSALTAVLAKAHVQWAQLSLSKNDLKVKGGMYTYRP